MNGVCLDVSVPARMRETRDEIMGAAATEMVILCFVVSHGQACVL